MFFGGHTLGMWNEDDVDATVGLLAVQRRANVARAVANLAAGLQPNTILGVGGMPIVESEVTPRARAANLQRLRDDATELRRRATRATARSYAPHEHPRAIIFIGATGVGKSFMARQRFPLAFWYACVLFCSAREPTSGPHSTTAAAAATTMQRLRWAPDAGGANNWIDGYDGHDTIVIDEAYDVERRRAKLPFGEMKQLLDWYPYSYQARVPPATAYNTA